MHEGREGVAEGGWEDMCSSRKPAPRHSWAQIKNSIVLLEANVGRASMNLAVRQALVRRCFWDLGGQASMTKQSPRRGG